ncbi:MAG: Ltp family lipoprotein [Cellulomonadaceae bacterium]|jgi:hypothetical protein|nr:Ltp family lipoprotein [Cellulomonadaceae bacterium]
MKLFTRIGAAAAAGAIVGSLLIAGSASATTLSGSSHAGFAQTSVPFLVKEMTGGQRKAVTTAKRYLKAMPFSKVRLINQLKYEGFTKSVATKAVNSLSVNWTKQAIKSGKTYRKLYSFSADRLVRQLRYEHFTAKEANTAVSSIFKKILAGKVKVSGTAKVGKKLTAKSSGFTPSAKKVAYKWLRNGKSIKGATKAKYTLTNSDAGKKITVKVTAKRSGYKSRVVTSNAVKVAAKASSSHNSSTAASKPKNPVSGPFKNCTEARNAGAAPVYRGDPGYSKNLDRDGDGVGCE